MIGKTNAQILGDSTKYETAVISLTSNQSSATALNGLAITVTYDDVTEKYTWDGNAISLDIPEGSTYTVSSGQLNNYTNPAAVAYTAEADNVRTINLNYSTFLLTLQVSVDTAASSTIGCTATVTVDSNGKTLTYTSEFSNVTTTNSTNQIYIPYLEGSEVNVTFSDIAGYASVSDQSVSMTSSGATITVQYLIQSEEALTYWVIFDDSTSTTTLEVGGNVTVRDNIRAKFKRCVAHPNSNGTASIAYLNETNSAVFPDGTTPSNTDYMMVHFPKYYYRCEDLGSNKHKLYIAETQLTGDYKEERECLIGMFEAYVDLSVLKSKPGVLSSGDISAVDFYTCAQANGSNWGVIDYRAHKTIANMFCIMYGNTDISTSNSSIPCSGGTKVYNSGNTGNTLSLGNSDGLVNNSSSFLGLEDCYYGKCEFVQGVGIYMGEWTAYDGGFCDAGTYDDISSNGNYSNVRIIGSNLINSGYIKSIKHGEYADVMPMTTGGSVTTYYADCVYADNYNENYVLYRSGSSDHGSLCGVFFSFAYIDSSHAYAYYGSRLGFYGTIKVVTPSQFNAL